MEKKNETMDVNAFLVKVTKNSMIKDQRRFLKTYFPLLEFINGLHMQPASSVLPSQAS